MAGGKSRGKRRAASLDNEIDPSVHEYAAHFLQSVKRLKPTESESSPQTTGPLPAVELGNGEGPSSISPHKETESRVLPSSEEQPMPDGRPLPAGPPDYIFQILADRPSDCAFAEATIDALVKDVLEETFAADATYPGQNHIGRVLDRLHTSGIPAERVAKIQVGFDRGWRQRTAERIGQRTVDEEELNSILTAMFTAVPFPPALHDFVFRCPPPNEPGLVDASIRTACAVTSHQSAIASPSMSVQQLPSPASAASPRVDASTSSSSINALAVRPLKREPGVATRGATAVQHSPTSSTTAYEDNVDHTDTAGQRALRIVEYLERFPASFDVFFLQVQDYRPALQSTGQECWADDEVFRGRARSVYKRLSTVERRQWRAIHKKLLRGDDGMLSSGRPQALLADQNIVQLLQATAVGPSPSAAHDMKPFYIPFANMEPCTTEYTVIFLVNTPDVTWKRVRRQRLSDACLSTFGADSSFLRVEQWGAHTWAARFGTKKCARRAKGKTVLLGGRRLVSEHLYREAPCVFICDFTDARVEEAEIALRIARAFAESTVKPKVSVQKAPKPSTGCQVLVELRRDDNLQQFYIPMLQTDRDRVFLACFKPRNLGARCALCLDVHSEHCTLAKPLRLPVDA